MTQDIIKKPIYFICEGRSENNYLNLLNKFFDENNINYIFQYNNVNLEGVFPNKGDLEANTCYSKMIKFFKEKFAQNIRSGTFVFWLDDDVFKRKEINKSSLEKIITEKFSSKNKEIRFIYSYENFEDFLVMHLDDDKINKWQNICEKCNHFKNPMKAKIYEEKFREIFPNYQKHILPDKIVIDNSKMKLLYDRQQNSQIKFKCDLIDFIRNKIEKL